MNNIEELKSAYRDVELTARNMRGKPEEYRVVTGFCPVNVVEMQAQKIQALIAQLEAAQKESAIRMEAIEQMRKTVAHNVERAQTAEAALSAANNGVTAENLRVIKMLLDVCGTAFELADDSCQQDVDGELCHVVPDSAFSRLSDALGEIENTLPDEYEDLPNIVLQWAAIPRHALQELFSAAPQPAGFTVEGE